MSFMRPDMSQFRLDAFVFILAAIVVWLLGATVMILLGIYLSTLIVAGLAGLLWWKTKQQREREAWANAGRCGRCGYDLRASGETCPECGTPVAEDLRRRRHIAAEIAKARAAGQAGVANISRR